MSTWRTGTGLTESYPGRLDIYYDSDITSFDGIVIDVHLGYKVLSNKKGWLAAVAGYLYQDFEYNTALVRQWSPSGLEGFDYVGDGSTSLEYKVYYKIPYFFE